MTDETHAITLYVNGIPYELTVPARRLLSDCLRHDLRLTGTHVGCEHGVCGACTVLVDGAPMRSCLLLAVSMDGQRITTVEGLAGPDGELSPVQRAFAECHALQCGFCTPGFLITITAALAENPAPSRDEAREIIGGNLCRCTGYQNIVAAVLRAAELGQPELGRPDPGQPELGQPDPGQPDPGQPELGQPDPGQPELDQAGRSLASLGSEISEQPQGDPA